MQYDAIAGDLIIGAGDDYVFLAVDCSAARNITLPLASAVSTGRIYVIKDATAQSETNTLTISASGADTIDGSASITVTSNGATVFLISNGVNSYKQL